MPHHSLDSVAIHHFRGIRDLQLDGLGRINVLVGDNNSGKTSVLEAISLLCNPFEPFEWLAMVHRRDFGRLDETRIQSLRWCFSQPTQHVDPDVMFESECVMSCVGLFPVRHLRATFREILGEPDPKRLERQRHARKLTEEDVDVFEPRRGAELVHFVESDAAPEKSNLFASSGISESEPIAIQVWEDEPFFRRPFRRKQHIRTETLTPYSYQINRLQVRYSSKHLFAKSRDMVLDLVREFDQDIEGIEIASMRGGRPALYLRHRQLGPAPLSVFGDALRRAVLLASALPAVQDGGVLFIDEIETGIHISLLQRLFSWVVQAARSLNVQILATSHSLEAVDALLAGSGPHADDVVTFHLAQSKEETRVKRYGEDLLVRLRRERGLDVR